MTTNPWDESLHPRENGGRFASVERDEETDVDLLSGGNAEPVFISATYRDKALACFSAVDAVNRVFGAPTGYEIDGAQRYYDDLEAALDAYETGAASRTETANALRDLAGLRLSEINAHRHSYDTVYVEEHLERVANLIEGKTPVEETPSCRTCLGRGEVETGETEHDTGATLTRGCGRCGGTGMVSASDFEAEQAELAEGLLTNADRWHGDDPEQAPSVIAAKQAWRDERGITLPQLRDPWGASEVGAAAASQPVDWKTAYRREETAKAAARWPGTVDRPLNDDAPF